MKKYLGIILLICFLLYPAVLHAEESPQRALFVSLIQDPPVLCSRSDILKLVRFAKEARIQTLFVQIYRANQAWFPSQVADSGPYEACLKNMKDDPFAFLIREAHGAGIEVHAWLNMLSLSQNENAPLLKKYGPEILTRNLQEKKTLKDYRIDDQYFLEPGDLRVREDLSRMVEEIVRTYPLLDGIQFDYIRYPDKHPAYGYTSMNMERFKKATAVTRFDEKNQAWRDWKRKQVTEFLGILIQSAKSIRPDIKISATGCMPHLRALEEAFQDWPSWLKHGQVDFVTLMSYTKSNNDFDKYIISAKNESSDFKKVNLAIGAYEMTKDPLTFLHQFQACEKSGARACAIFHYGSLLENDELAHSLLFNSSKIKS